MSDRYLHDDTTHTPERPYDEVSRYAEIEPTAAQKARWQAEIAFERPLIDDDDLKRAERWRLEIASILIQAGIPGVRAGELALRIKERLREPL